MPRKNPPELTIQQHIADYLVREHKYAVVEIQFCPDAARLEVANIGVVCGDRATQLAFKQLEFDLVQLPAQSSH